MSFSRALLTITLLLLSGCTIFKKKPSAIIGNPLPQEKVASLVASLRSRDAEIDNFRGLFRSKFSHGEDSWTARQAVVFEKPERLRIEALPTVGATTLSLLVTNNGVATFLDVGEKQAYVGSAEKDFFTQFLKISAGERELMSLFSGRIPPRYLVDGRLRFLETPDLYVIARGEGEYVWQVDKKTLLCRYVEVRDPFNQRLLFSVEYGNPNARVTALVPGEMKITSHRDSSVAEGKLLSAKINSVIPASLFSVKIPPDYSVKE